MRDSSGGAPRRVGRPVAVRLREALVALTGNHGAILRQSERPWASVTFDGARHTVELAFEGDAAIEAGEHFIAALPEHEFAIPGQLVAEATVVGAEHMLAPCPRLSVTCELLLLKDA